METAERALLEKALWRLELLQSQLAARSKEAIEIRALLKAVLHLSEQAAKSKEVSDE